VRNLLIPIAVAAIAVAATVDAVRGGSNAPAPPPSTAAPSTTEEGGLEGPNVPPAGALEGTLVVATTDGCRLQTVAFDDSKLGQPGPETACALWASPSGNLAVVATDGSSSAHTIALTRLGDPPELLATLGTAREEVVWSPDGARIAWCTPSGDSVVHSLGSGRQARRPGCDPRFGPDGALLTRPERARTAELWKDGSVLFDELDLARGFTNGSTGRIDLLGYDVGSGGLLAIAVSRVGALGSDAVLELWRADVLEQAVELPAVRGPNGEWLGEFVRFSPSGNEVAISFSRSSGQIGIFDLRSGEASVHEQRAFAWSPDGAWLALATENEIDVYGAVRSEPVYTLPLRASGLGWAPPSENP
jgi:hypothetical protein